METLETLKFYMGYLEISEKLNFSWIINEYFKLGNLGTNKLLPDQGNNYWNFGTLLIDGTRSSHR